ncbi:MAG: hypothetical protein K2K90_05885 [Lachnospiraceae bacterium]|nr:hypothetical protein [Lachnospiraceae bacterium]
MKNYLYKYRAALLSCIPALVIFLLATYRLSETGQPILFNDEIGYWSNSAFFLGMDWKSVTGRIGYYSYGYSLLLVLVRLLGRWRGWDWRALHHAAVIMNAGFLVIGYAIALKLAKRYLPEMGRVVRTMACFTVFTYSSYIVYAHITWTECTLMFFFWVFLYVMMRVTDQPGIRNHVAYAVVSFYIYTVHQRALGIVVTSVIIVLYMRLMRRNKMQDVAAFLGSMYLCGLCHAMIKTNLQQVNYLGGEPVGLRGLLGYAFTRISFVFLAGGLILLLVLYLIEKRKYKILLAFLAGGAVLCAAVFLGGGQALRLGSGEGNRLSVNDFAGQWGVIKNLFSAKGLARLGISMAGKWFYMAAVSGLVACWGIWGLFKNIWYFLRDSISQIKMSYGKKEEQDGEPLTVAGMEEHIWLFGMFLAWISTFLISALYKEGLYKNDDLFNGRYVEFTIGFILLYGFYRLLNDKKWVRTAVLYMILYIAAGKLCQHLVDGLQRKEFELAHCVMFGRVFWNYQVPYGKVAELTRYVMPMSVSFLILLKAARDKLPRAAVARTILALMIPVAVWSYLGKTIVDAYVVVRNEKQERPFVQFSDWIRILGNEEKVYYISDSSNDRNPGLMQFMLQEQPVTVAAVTDLSYQEDAFYIMKDYLWQTEGVALADECEAIMRTAGYILAVNKNQNLARQWDPFRE